MVDNNKKQNRFSATHVFIIVSVLFSGLLVFSGCGKSKTEVESLEIDPEKIVSMRTLDVNTLISDSGVTKYRITAKDWIIFDRAKNPYWFFPEKLHLEKFDSIYQVEASIDADTAYYFKNEKLWHLIGNVKVVNVDDEKFETEELFWDQRKQKIYSDKFIHIEQKDLIIEGVGFDSNESMTKYSIRNTSGIIPMTDALPPATDSVSVAGPEKTEP